MRRFLKIMLYLGLGGLSLAIITLVVAYLIISPGLPDVEVLKEVRFQVPLRVYTRDKKLLAVFGEKRRIPVRYPDVPEQLIQAFVAGEDYRFFEHPGVDYQGILRAVWHIVKTGEKGPGGSTITMQLTRAIFLSYETTFQRKLTEIFLALKIERELSKNEILELYLNQIYLGHRAYGVAAAAQVYYGKSLSQLTLAQAAMIASLPKAPSRINPINRPARATSRRNYVLGRMLALGKVTQAEHDQAVAVKDQAYLHSPTVEVDAPYVAEMARAEMLDRFGQDAYTDGYHVYTSVDSRLQRAAHQSLRNGLMAYDRRHGYRGPVTNNALTSRQGTEDWAKILSDHTDAAGLRVGLVIEAAQDLALVYLKDGQTVPLGLASVDWARRYISVNSRGPRPKAVDRVLSAGDVVYVSRHRDGSWRLAQVPHVQGALVSIRPEDGAILGLSGGFDFSLSKFNRATQAPRQPGSSFKPIIYSAALNKGFTTATLINDAPVVFDDKKLERQWRPENYSGKFFGPTRLREGMVKSRNLVSIRVLRQIGVGYARNYASKFGFDPAKLPNDLSLALGSATLTPISMARAYGVLANGGFLIKPYLISRIEDDRGELIFSATPAVACADCDIEQIEDNSDATPSKMRAERTVAADNVYMITSIMRDVIKRGTGRKARSLGRNDLAGKTGTTNDQRDAWFSGFNHAVATTTWVGFDQLAPLGKGEVGGRAALPIWIDYMRTALDGVPETELPMPENLITVRINGETGLLAEQGDPDAVLEIFRIDQVPNAGKGNAKGNGSDRKDPLDIF